MIHYADTLKNVSPDKLCGGFFENWPNPPSPEIHLQPFYAALGMKPAVDMMLRRYENQSGKKSPGTIY